MLCCSNGTEKRNTQCENFKNITSQNLKKLQKLAMTRQIFFNIKKQRIIGVAIGNARSEQKPVETKYISYFVLTGLHFHF